MPVAVSVVSPHWTISAAIAAFQDAAGGGQRAGDIGGENRRDDQPAPPDPPRHAQISGDILEIARQATKRRR